MVVTIYGKTNCPHCVAAQKMCTKKEIKYVYKSLDTDYNSDKVMEMTVAHCWRSFPFVFVDDEFIGGAQELNKYLRKL